MTCMQPGNNVRGKYFCFKLALKVLMEMIIVLNMKCHSPNCSRYTETQWIKCDIEHLIVQYLCPLPPPPPPKAFDIKTWFSMKYKFCMYVQ